MDDLLRDFLTETSESLALLDAELVGLEQSPEPAQLQSVFRLFHTVKGTCGFFGLSRLEALAHAAETVLVRIRDGELAVAPGVVTLVLESLDRIKDLLTAIEAAGAEPAGNDSALIAQLNGIRVDAPQAATPASAAAAPAAPAVAAQSIRVTVDLLDRVMTLASELVLSRNQLLQLLRREPESPFAAPLQRLSKVTTELQEGVMKARMQPIGDIWSKLPRVVRDLARDLGKKIELELHGNDTEIDRQVLELIKDPLTHMVRNSADHGIEPPAERMRLGKPEAGRITLKASHEGGQVVIVIADDGSGLALDRIKAKALATGIAGEAELAAMSEAHLRHLIFRPGFSTAASVTSISGRGVGLDVVRNNIERLGGTIEVDSVAGRGSTFTVTIPLTLAIVSALILECAGERYALPQLAVRELVQAGADVEHRIEWLNAAPVMRLRDRLLPLVSLKRLLGLSDRDEMAAGAALVIVIEIGGASLGLVVDRVFDAEEIVVKPVPPLLRGIPIFAGNTILGDGRVIMILDPAGILAASGASDAAPGGTVASPASPDATGEPSYSLLLFRAGPGAPKAVPLGIVARLEEIDLGAVECAEGRPVVQYRGRLMPLATIGPDQRLVGAGRRPVLVFAHGDGALGLVVDEIEDIVDTTIAVERVTGRPGLLGSAIIAGKATDIIDAAFYLKDGGASFSGTPEPKRPRRRVLLVEDSAFFRNLLTPLLAMAGYAVTGVESAGRALELCEAGEDFDAILSGIDMPGMDGFAFASSLRGSRWRDTPLLALAPGAQPADDARGRAAGFSATVARLDRDRLLGSLASALHRTPDAA